MNEKAIQIKIFNNKHDKKEQIASFFFLFFLALNVSTCFIFYFSWFSKGTIVLASVCLFFMVIFSKGFLFYKKPSWIFLILILSILFVSTLTGFSIEAINYIIKILLCLCGISIMKHEKLDVFFIIFSIAKVFLIWGFACELYTLINIDFLPVTNTYYTTWGESRNLYAFLISKNYSGTYIGNHLFTRMHAPFSEPGVAQLFFNFGLFYSLFYLKKTKKWTVLFSLGIVLSLSLTGVAIECLLFAFFLFAHKKKEAIPFCFLLFALLIILYINKQETESDLDRTNDLLNMISTISSSFPIGKGIGNYETVRYVSSLGKEFTSSNFCGLLSPLLYLGVFSLPYYYLLIIGIKYQQFYYEPKGAKFGFMILITITLLTQPMAFSPFILIIMVNGVLSKYNRTIKKINYQNHLSNPNFAFLIKRKCI
jgi:hypothetical protein